MDQSVQLCLHCCVRWCVDQSVQLCLHCCVRWCVDQSVQLCLHCCVFTHVVLGDCPSQGTRPSQWANVVCAKYPTTETLG